LQDKSPVTHKSPLIVVSPNSAGILIFFGNALVVLTLYRSFTSSARALISTSIPRTFLIKKF